jgi:FMN phosphatase YigB (HAD superfamily)
MYKLRTIDVWDTMLRRKSYPEFSKLVSAHVLNLTRRCDIAAAYPDHWAIYQERCAIEGELARQGGGEYEIQDVLLQLLERILHAEDQSAEDLLAIATGLAELEFEFELRNTYLDPDLFEFIAKYPAERTIFLSDFYMSAVKLKRLLTHHGVSHKVPDGISSCDVGLNKRSGQLFVHVHETYSITPSEHVHIGDNLRADVEVPRRKGIKAVHFEPEEEHFKRQEKAIFLTDRAALFRHISAKVEAAVEAESSTLQGRALQAFRLGLYAAPLLIGFNLHVAEHALSNRLERLFFFTREGEFFLQVWRSLFPNNQLAGIQLPPVEVLEVSRIATFCASLRNVSTAEMMRLWTLYSTQSVAALLKTLGMDPPEFAQTCQAHGLTLDEAIASPWKDVRIQALFADPAFSEPISEKSQHDRKCLLKYLRQRDWAEGLTRVGVVDIGWRGTIQDNLAALLPHCQLHGYYMGLLRFLNPQLGNCKKSAFGPNLNVAPEYRALLSGVSLLEMLCNSPHGSVVGYEPENAQAIRLLDQKENQVFHNYTAYFQKGITLAAACWADPIDSHVITSGELRSAGCDVWRKLVDNPHQSLVEIHASLTYNELFGLGTFVDKRVVPSIADLVIATVHRRTRLSVILFIKQTPRTAIIWRRQDLNVAHRAILGATLELAWLCKRILYRVKRP